MENQKHRGGKKGRKRGRNFRLSGDSKRSGKVTRYRSRHNIPEGSRKENHANGRCPKHN